MAMEERVTRSEERIAKLNMVVFKRLEERRNLKNKILNIDELTATEFRTTMKRKKYVPSE